MQPVGEDLSLLRGGLGLVFGRHFLVADLFQRVVPHRRVAFDIIERFEPLKIEVPLLLLRGVAGDAVFVEDRFDRLIEDRRKRGSGAWCRILLGCARVDSEAHANENRHENAC